MAAYSKALAWESLPDSIRDKYRRKKEVFKGITHDDLEEFARVVAYKVFHNLKNGEEMDPTKDPLEICTDEGMISASEYWKDHYENSNKV